MKLTVAGCALKSSAEVCFSPAVNLKKKVKGIERFSHNFYIIADVPVDEIQICAVSELAVRIKERLSMYTDRTNQLHLEWHPFEENCLPHNVDNLLIFPDWTSFKFRHLDLRRLSWVDKAKGLARL